MKRTKGHIDIDRLVRGDYRQWERFVKDVSPVVYSVLNKTLSVAGQSAEGSSDLLQDVFVKLLYERDLEVREVAQLLGIKEQSVRSARHKAIATLRSHLFKK